MRDDVREGGLAQAWRAVQQDVIQGFAAIAGGLDEDLELFAHALLADVLVERAGTQRAVDGLLVGRCGAGGHDARGVGLRRERI